MKFWNAVKVWLIAAVMGVFFSITVLAADYSIYDCFWSEDNNKEVAVWYRTENATSFKVGLFTDDGSQIGSWHTTENTSYDFTKAISKNGSDTYYFIVYPTKGGSRYAVASDNIRVSVGYDDDYEIAYCEWSAEAKKQVALWASTEKSTSYKVGLFTKNGTQVGSWHTTDNNYYDFTNIIKDKGTNTYYFAVYPVKGGSEYVICSETKKVNVPGSQANSGSSSSSGGPGSAEWVKNSNGTWSYRLANGTFAAACWQLINGKWYYFGSDAIMDTGWLNLNGKWYYLENIGTGSMPLGALYMNCVTPDGNVVDADGVWTGQKASDSSWYKADHSLGTISVTLPAGSSSGWNYSISNREVIYCENAGSSSDGTHYMMFSPTGICGSSSITFTSSLGSHYMDIWVNESGDFDILQAR